MSASQVDQRIAAQSSNADRRRLAGTTNGGIAETQQMLDFCAEHGPGADIDIIYADQINAAYVGDRPSACGTMT